MPSEPTTKGQPQIETRDLVVDFSRFYILMLLSEGPRHGYEILHEIARRIGREASPSLVYPFLRLLEEHGYIKQHSEHVGRKVRKKYSLTSPGRNLCSRLFKQFANLVSTAIQPSLDTCPHCGCKIYSGGYPLKINGKMLMFCCKYCAGSYKKSSAPTFGSILPRGRR